MMTMLTSLILLQVFFQPSLCLPSQFVADVFSNVDAISGTFSPNPRNSGKPMLLLTSKDGKVMAFEDPDNSGTNFVIADMKNIVCSNGERGLQSIRSHPDFNSNRLIYMYYTRFRTECTASTSTGPRNRVSRFKMNPTTLQIDLNSEEILLETPPGPNTNHNGGFIEFAQDGKLYVSTGDGGSSGEVSQDLRHLHGKILRLNPNGTIPLDNPYQTEGIRCGTIGGSTTTGSCGEIFAYGLRNPWRMAFDPNEKTKVKFHINDVGANHWEEVSIGGTGFEKANYGWPTMEGPCRRGLFNDCPVPTQTIDPIFYYKHSGDACITGGIFVPDGVWPSQYKYLYIDFVFGTIYNMIEDPSKTCRTCNPPTSGYRSETFYTLDRAVDFFFGPYKNTQALYVVSRSTSEQRVRRIYFTGTANRSPIASILVTDTTVTVGELIALDGSNSSDPDGDTLTFMWDLGDGSTSAASILQYSYGSKGDFTVTLTVTDALGQQDQVSIQIIVGIPPTAKMLSPTVGQTFSVGQAIRLRGSGLDSKGNVLASSQLFWEVRKHHATHYHPYLERRAGNNFTISPAPGPEDIDAALNSYLEIIMYAVDADGLTTTITRLVKPRIVYIQVKSSPSKLEILVDQNPIVTPRTIATWENHTLALGVQNQKGYNFSKWSDRGSRYHSILIPPATSTNLSIQANFIKEFMPLNTKVRNCSPTSKCGRCQGHCESNDECFSHLVCFKKGGRGKSVPGCTGIDNSNTDWCVYP